MPLLVADQRSPEWHAARAGKITASLAAACLGLDPHRGPLSAWNEITGKSKRADNRHLQWGREHEARAVQKYEVETGNLVTPTGFWVHESIGWLGASPDGLIGPNALLETKCPQELPRDKETGVLSVPAHHEIQVRVQLAVTQRGWCAYFALDPQDEFFNATVVRDIEVELDLISRLEFFYRAYVLTGTPPPRRRKDATAAAAEQRAID
jgi:exodeoxyribonuclease (lambda-induced)